MSCRVHSAAVSTPAATSSSLDSKRSRDVLRFAVLAWMVFAIAIAAMTALKKDTLALTNGDRVEGRITATSAAAVTVRIKDRGQAVERTIPRAEIDHISPLGDRSVTGVYRRASELWWSRGPLYTEGVAGFLYLPQAALVFSPFAALPPHAGEVLWRWVGILGYAWGILSLTRLLFGSRWPAAFLLASLLAIPAAMGSAQNGQTNLVMGGLFALAAAECARNRLWWATLWLMLAFACKPIALPVMLLLAAVYPRLIPRLAVGGVVFAIAPFINPDPAYVWEQYRAAIGKIAAAAKPVEPYQDLRGMLMDFGFNPDAWAIALPMRDASGAARMLGVLTLVRAFAAAVALGLSLLIARRFRDPARAVYVLAVGVIYIMVFNPRTEGVTYAMLGPVAALFAAAAILRKDWRSAIPLITFCLLLQFSRVVTNGANNWVRPVSTLVFAAYVCSHVVRGRPALGADNRREGDTITLGHASQ